MFGLTHVRQHRTMTHMSDTATHDIPPITLGWRLRIAMERAGIKAETLAAEFDVHRGTITRWTHDKGAPPRRPQLKMWAELCKVPYEWLAGELFADPTVEPAAEVPHPRRRATDITEDSTESPGQYTDASLACRVLDVVVPELVAH